MEDVRVGEVAHHPAHLHHRVLVLAQQQERRLHLVPDEQVLPQAVLSKPVLEEPSHTSHQTEHHWRRVSLSAQPDGQETPEALPPQHPLVEAPLTEAVDQPGSQQGSSLETAPQGVTVPDPGQPVLIGQDQVQRSSPVPSAQQLLHGWSDVQDRQGGAL